MLTQSRRLHRACLSIVAVLITPASLGAQAWQIAITPTAAFELPFTVYDGPGRRVFASGPPNAQYRMRVDAHPVYGGTISSGVGASAAWRLRLGYTSGTGRAAVLSCESAPFCTTVKSDATSARTTLAVSRRFAPMWARAIAIEPSLGVADTRLRIRAVVPSAIAPDYTRRGVALSLGSGLSRRIGRRARARLDGSVTHMRTDVRALERYFKADNVSSTLDLMEQSSSTAPLLWSVGVGVSIELFKQQSASEPSRWRPHDEVLRSTRAVRDRP